MDGIKRVSPPDKETNNFYSPLWGLMVSQFMVREQLGSYDIWFVTCEIESREIRRLSKRLSWRQRCDEKYGLVGLNIHESHTWSLLRAKNMSRRPHLYYQTSQCNNRK